MASIQNTDALRNVDSLPPVDIGSAGEQQLDESERNVTQPQETPAVSAQTPSKIEKRDTQITGFRHPQLMVPVMQGRSMLYRREQRFAECIRFCWCRPMGWMAKSELAKARDLHHAGDLEGARSALRCARVWSISGLITGLLILLTVVLAIYFLIFYLSEAS